MLKEDTFKPLSSEPHHPEVPQTAIFYPDAPLLSKQPSAGGK